MFQTSWDRGKKRLGDLWGAQKTPVWNIPQVKRFTGKTGDHIILEKDQPINQVWDEGHHFFKL